MDYELLGALIGSAWRENHDNPSNLYRYTAEFAGMLIYNVHVPSDKREVFSRALSNTMRGRCWSCGVVTDSRWSTGVYGCPACVVQKVNPLGREKGKN